MTLLRKSGRFEMTEREGAVIFWTKDESDGDVDQDKMAHRSAHVPGVTDTASRPTMVETTTKFPTSGVHRQNMMPSKPHRKMGGGGNPSSKRKTITSQDSGTSGDSFAVRPSLKDLRPEDKKRVANLIRELAKLGEEKEVAMEQLQVERREHDLRTKDMQDQVVDILKERESLQLQLLECQKLLAEYQTKVSQDQKSPSGSLQDHSSTTREASRRNSGRSPVKESVQIIPTSDRHSDSHGSFVQLRSVPDISSLEERLSVASSMKTDTNNISVKTPAYVDDNIPKGIDGEFTPALSSTHRPHQLQSRLVKNTELDGTLIDHARKNGGESAMSYQLSPSVTGNAKPNLQKHDHSHPLIRNRDGLKGMSSTRASSEDFRPLREEKDSTKSSSRRNMSSSRDGSQRQHWASLPEMDTHHSYGHQDRGQQVTHHNKEVDLCGDDDDDDDRHEQVVSKHPIQKPMPGAVGYPDPRTSGLRQQDLGLLRVKLQKEQEWLQHKLAEQEQLLQQKQRDIQAQKQQLSQMAAHQDDGMFLSTGGQVRRTRLPQDREARHREYRTKIQEDQRTGVHNDRMNEHSEKHWRREPDGRQGMIRSPWRQSIVDAWNDREEVSTNYPPADVVYQGRGHHLDMERDRYISSTQNGDPWLREDDYYEAYRDYDPVEEEEELGEVHGEPWYQMRTEIEGERRDDNIQGYASLHHQINQRHPGMTANSATSQHDQSYHITESAPHLHNAIGGRTNRAPSSSLPQKQRGSISAILEGDFDPSYPPQLHKTKPRVDVRMSQQHGQYLMNQPGSSPAPQSRQRFGPRGVVEAYDIRSGPRRKPLYSQVDRRNLPQSNTRGHHIGVGDRKKVTDQEQKAKPSVSSSVPHAAHSNITKSHLVRRSHDVIREIGRLLNEDVDQGDEEESKVLEEVFFLG